MKEYQDFNKDFRKLIVEQFDDNVTIDSVLLHLLKRHILKSKHVKIFVVKMFLQDCLQRGYSHMRSYRETIDKFNVSKSFIDNCRFYHIDMN